MTKVSNKGQGVGPVRTGRRRKKKEWREEERGVKGGEGERKGVGGGGTV